MPCIDKIAVDILNSCDPIPRGGFETIAWVINRSEIDTITYDSTYDTLVEAITLDAGTGAYSVTAVKKEMNAGFDLSQSDDVADTFLNYFSFKPYEKTAAAIDNLDSMNDLVVIAELKGEKTEGCFVIYGLERGLWKNTSTQRRNDSNGLPIYEMQSQEGQGERYSRFVFWNTDYTTSKAALDALLVGSYVSEYQDVYDALTTPPSSAIAGEQNTMVAALVTAGIWAKLDIFYLFAQSTNGASEALLNWINPGTYDATLGGTAPTFVSLEGFAGDGTIGSYIDLNYNPTSHGVNYIQDDASIGWYNRTNSEEDSVLMGVKDDVVGVRMDANYNKSANTLWYYTHCTVVATIANADTSGMYVQQRTASNALAIFRNGSSIDTDTEASTGLPNQNIYACGHNDDGDHREQSTMQISAAFAGSSLSGGEITTLTNAIEAYMDSNSKGVIP